MTVRNFYTVLGVSPDSEDVVIAAAYKALMRKYHPDKNAQVDATLKAAEINEAYAVLGDPERRKVYDRVNGYSTSAEDVEEQFRYSGTSSMEDREPEPAVEINNISGSVLKQRAGQFIVIALILIGFAWMINAPQTSSSSEATQDYTDYTAGSSAADNSGLLDNAAQLGTEPLSPSFEIAGMSDAPEKTLSAQPPLSYPDIENAVLEFDRVLDRRGILGAKAYSVKCHETAKANVEWSKYDFCVAFDFAAVQLDHAVSESGGAAPNAYFSFMKDNAANQYVGAKFMTYAVTQRVSAIERAVRPVLLETISARIEKNSETTPNEELSGNLSATE